MRTVILAYAGLALAVTGSAKASEVYYGQGNGLSIELGLRAKLIPLVNGIPQVHRP